MEWIKIDGTSSTTITGFIIKDIGTETLPQRDIESIKVDGRNGNLYIDNETYDVIDRTVIGVATDLTKIDDIKSFLSASGTVEFSSTENVQREYIIKNQVNFDKYLTHLKEFPIQFELHPIGYSTTLTTVTKTTSPASFTVGGNIGVKPILEIKGTGEVVIALNSTEFTLADASTTAYIVDCDLQNVKKNDLNVNDEFTGDFPVLVVGSNSLTWTGTVSEIKIKYYVGWL